jgi:hypothetical protein
MVDIPHERGARLLKFLSSVCDANVLPVHSSYHFFESQLNVNTRNASSTLPVWALYSKIMCKAIRFKAARTFNDYGRNISSCM